VTRAASSRLPLPGVAEDPWILEPADALDESRNTGDADLKLLLLAVAEVELDDDVRLCERSADLCGSHNRSVQLD
jgi:hypothetical protein